jgi:hypothetical protein
MAEPNKQKIETFRKLYLMGFMTMPEAMGVLLSDLAHSLDQRELREKWLYHVHVANNLPKSDPYLVTEQNMRTVVSDIDSKYKPKLDQVRERLKAYPFFQGVSYEFKQVDIDKIIALQGSIDLGTIELFKKRVGPNLTLEDTLDLCFKVSRTNPDITYARAGDNSFSFSTDDEDVRVGQPEVRMLPKYPDSQKSCLHSWFRRSVSPCREIVEHAAKSFRPAEAISHYPTEWIPPGIRIEGVESEATSLHSNRFGFSKRDRGFIE